MKKNLLILSCITIICLVIITCLINIRYNFINNSYKENLEYEDYVKNDITGSNLMTLINKVIDDNEKNEVQKNDNGFYISNNENSIIIEIKFLENDAVYRMEQIARQGTESFIKYYNSMLFKCIKKEYHKETKRLSYMYFEEI